MTYLLNASDYIPSGFTACMVFLIIHEIGLRIKNEQVFWIHRIVILLLGLYFTVVFSITVSPVYGFSLSHFANSINLKPLQVFNDMSLNPMNFWGNILLFIPFGALLVLLSYRCQKLYVSLIMGVGLSSFIEVLQLFGTRGTDIDDIILNTGGTLYGYLLGKLILYAVPSLRKKVGVLIRNDNTYCRKRHDTGTIVNLAIIILISVFISGFSIKTATIEPPMTSVINNPPIQISEDINATNAYLCNVSSHTVLYEKKSNQRIAPASTAKMLTALTALDYCDENDEVLVGKEIKRIAEDASRAWFNVGNRLTIRQLLDALLLPSGNDAAYTLAVFTGKRICNNEAISTDKAIAAFITAMNKKAFDIGAIHSNFISPDGYDADGQYTTAYDLACIAKAFLDSSILKDIAGSYRVSDVWLSGQAVTYYNTNELINPDSPYYLKCVAGLKTGKSELAGNCLVSCAYINKDLYICVVMGSTDEGRWRDSIRLYQAIQ